MKKIYTIRNSMQQQVHMWDDRRIEDEVSACAKRNLAAYFVKYLPKYEQIVEAGCGLGAWVVFLHERGYDIVGIDNNKTVIERLKDGRPSVKVEYGDIRKLPYDNGHFGACISLGVVEHFEEGCDEAMNEASRVLKMGGLLFFSVPMENIFRKIVAHPLRSLYLGYRRAKGDASHFVEYRYNRQEVECLLRKYGFELIVSDWDDFVDKNMSLGIWADFPPLHSRGLYGLNLLGRAVAFTMNSFSRWAAPAGVFCLARKKG